MSLLNPQEDLEMNAGILRSVRRHVIALTLAGLLALSAAYTPVLLDGLAGTSTVTPAMACQNSGSGCG
jgi:hypothetical protein